MVRIEFSPPAPNTSPKLLANVVLYLDGTLLQDMKLIGFSVWKGRDGQPSVSFPSYPGSKGAYYLLREATEDGKASFRLKAIIVKEYVEWLGSKRASRR